MKTKLFRSADLFMNSKTRLVVLLTMLIQLLDIRAQTPTTLGAISAAVDGPTTAAVAPTNQNQQVVGQVPKDWRPGTSTVVTGVAAEKAKAAAIAKYPNGTVNRVLKLGDGSYAVHTVQTAWPHHVFADKDFRVIGAIGAPATLPSSADTRWSAPALSLSEPNSLGSERSATQVSSNSLTHKQEALPSLDLNSNGFATLSEWQSDTNSANMEPFAISNQDLDRFRNQGPGHAKRFQFLGGDNPVDDLQPFVERNDRPLEGLRLFSIHF